MFQTYIFIEIVQRTKNLKIECILSETEIYLF